MHNIKVCSEVYNLQTRIDLKQNLKNTESDIILEEKKKKRKTVNKGHAGMEKGRQWEEEAGKKAVDPLGGGGSQS